ncbi:MAG: c-type cytochrome [Ginsengibacter sp.]
MKKIYTVACMAISLLILLISNSCNNPSDKTAVNDKAKDSINVRISRGSYLVNTVCICMHCHADRDFTKFSGPIVPGTEGKGGEEINPGIYVRNITPYALGDWTDDEIYRVLTTGIRKNGDTLTMLMPYAAYVKMPKEEIYSIIAYLRTLKPIAYKVPERKIDGAVRQFWTDVYKKIYFKRAGEKMPLPSPGDKMAMGAYLVNAGNCNGCHTKFHRKIMDFDPDAYLAGGNLFNDSARNIKVTTANLTPDTATGIGSWTEEMFLNKFKNYRDKSACNYSPGKYNTFMPWTVVANMKDDDITAIYAYLRTIKPVKNQVNKWPQ